MTWWTLCCASQANLVLFTLCLFCYVSERFWAALLSVACWSECISHPEICVYLRKVKWQTCICFCFFTETEKILLVYVAKGKRHDAMLGKCFLRTARLGWDWRGDRGYAAKMWILWWEESVWRGVWTQTHRLPAGRWNSVHLWLQWPRAAGTREGQEETRFGNVVMFFFFFDDYHTWYRFISLKRFLFFFFWQNMLWRWTHRSLWRCHAGSATRWPWTTRDRFTPGVWAQMDSWVWITLKNVYVCQGKFGTMLALIRLTKYFGQFCVIRQKKWVFWHKSAYFIWDHMTRDNHLL